MVNPILTVTRWKGNCYAVGITVTLENMSGFSAGLVLIRPYRENELCHGIDPNLWLRLQRIFDPILSRMEKVAILNLTIADATEPITLDEGTGGALATTIQLATKHIPATSDICILAQISEDQSFSPLEHNDCEQRTKVFSS